MIRLTIKDKNDKAIVSQGENSLERDGGKAQRPYTCGTVVPGTGVNPDEGQNGSGLPGIPDIPVGLPGTDSSGFTGLGGFLDSVLQGVKRA